MAGLGVFIFIAVLAGLTVNASASNWVSLGESTAHENVLIDTESIEVGNGSKTAWWKTEKTSGDLKVHSVFFRDSKKFANDLVIEYDKSRNTTNSYDDRGSHPMSIPPDSIAERLYDYLFSAESSANRPPSADAGNWVFVGKTAADENVLIDTDSIEVGNGWKIAWWKTEKKSGDAVYRCKFFSGSKKYIGLAYFEYDKFENVVDSGKGNGGMDLIVPDSVGETIYNYLFSKTETGPSPNNWSPRRDRM